MLSSEWPRELPGIGHFVRDSRMPNQDGRFISSYPYLHIMVTHLLALSNNGLPPLFTFLPLSSHCQLPASLLSSILL